MQNTLACKFSSFNRNILLAAKKTKKTQFFCYFFLMIAVWSCFFLTNQQKAHSMWINSLAYQQACQQRGASVSFLSLKGMIWVLIIQHLTGLNVTTKKQKSYKCGCLYVRLILNTLVYPTRNGSEKRSQLLRTGQWGKKPRFESSWNTRGLVIGNACKKTSKILQLKEFLAFCLSLSRGQKPVFVKLSVIFH